MEQPQDYKLVIAGKWLRTQAEELQTQADAVDVMEDEYGGENKATLVDESENLREVGNWLIQQGGGE